MTEAESTAEEEVGFVAERARLFQAVAVAVAVETPVESRRAFASSEAAPLRPWWWCGVATRIHSTLPSPCCRFDFML